MPKENHQRTNNVMAKGKRQENDKRTNNIMAKGKRQKDK
jgi:hypothetical protein